MGVSNLKTSTFRITNCNRINKLNHRITKTKRAGHDVRLDFELYAFVKLVENFYDLKPDVVDHMIFILKRLMSDYHMLCNNMTMENLVLASALYSMECSGLPLYENNDISGFVNYLYKPSQQKAGLHRFTKFIKRCKICFMTLQKRYYLMCLKVIEMLIRS